MYFDNLKGYLDRADKLLIQGDNVSISYCGLELRKAIELIVWTQFRTAFQKVINRNTSLTFFDFIFGTQSQSISKMYKMLKKHCPNYVEHAKNETVFTYFSAVGDAPLKEVGTFCYIKGDLPNSDYKYLSEIIHYEKEFHPTSFRVDENRIKTILDKLLYINDNYTFRKVSPVASDNVEEIIQDFESEFKLKIN